jgi:virginiamycin B lyase
MRINKRNPTINRRARFIVATPDLLGGQSPHERTLFCSTRPPTLLVNVHNRSLQRLIAYPNSLIKQHDHVHRSPSMASSHSHNITLKHLLPTLTIIVLLLLLSACSNALDNPTNISSSTVATSGATTAGTFHEYSLPQPNSDIMRPAIDHEGCIWFGEMGHNYLAVFDPRTQTFQQTTPPHGASGIMGIAVANDDTIWFAEQYANYIGHYTSTTQHYQIYNLPQLTVPDPSNKHNTLTLPSAPNDIALDARGNIWFTELNADSLAMLDPHTGHIKQYSLSTHATVQTLNPYGIAVDPQGTIWFTESSTNHLGRLDPQTGTIRTFNAPGSNTTLMEVASDSHGTIWATSFNTSQLFKFDQSKNIFTRYNTSSDSSAEGGLYGLAITPTNDIWVTLTENNAIGRLDLSTQSLIPYQIPTANSLPFGIAIGKDHTLWFTESHSNKIGTLQL